MSSPLTKVSDTEYVEGYWYSEDKDYKLYPKPLPTNNPVDPIFLSKLKLITSSIENGKVGSFVYYRGFSPCRLCDYKYNGAKEYKFTLDGITYRYPEGLLHYYEKHNVQPSKEFYDVVMKL